ncbi:CD209 antigen-like isoform X7 [Myxocyprinus asiaticus]|uniref:CD209 antigen-like isoform X6 n=1 Tax=Myxocyprinus asiaticus TaxID=70543 RepID=UPI00222380F4|nr:CD209 antigen-like isoform X6 [Myxocyprinus asiaticus]XP_051560241.1 CD209 antigen-like isoform X7 [Myxocyprinus asiaticus]
MENIYENDEHKNCIKSNERDAGTEDKDTIESQKLSFIQTEAKARHFGGNRRFVLSTVSLGLMCVLLVIGIIVQHHKLTAERDLLKMSYMDIVKEYNQTISRLQVNYSDQTIAKDRLQSSFNSLNQTNLELETSINSLTAEKNQLQRNYDSLNQKKLELESEVNSTSDELKKRGWFFISSEEKSWSDSRQFCRDHGGDLVIINSEEKQRFISSFKMSVWIGLSDIENEGSMTWVDNSPLKKGFWMAGEPNNLANEDCIELIPSLPVLNNWNDLLCSLNRKCICESFLPDNTFTHVEM